MSEKRAAKLSIPVINLVCLNICYMYILPEIGKAYHTLTIRFRVRVRVRVVHSETSTLTAAL